MGRPELPLPTRGSLGQLAGWLRAWRKEAKLTYRQLSRKTGIPTVTLQRAADGKTLPAESVVEGYARACGGDLALARTLWLQATEERRANRRTTTEARDYRREITRPEQVNTQATLVRALRYQRARAGNPTYLELSERASALTDGAPAVLPVSTISDLLNGRSRPRTPDSVLTFLLACGVLPAELDRWREAWLRAFHGEDRKDPKTEAAGLIALRSSIAAKERGDRAHQHVLTNRQALGAYLRRRRQAFTNEQYFYLRKLAEGERIPEIARHTREGRPAVSRTISNLLTAIVQDPLWQEMAPPDLREPKQARVTADEIVRRD